MLAVPLIGPIMGRRRIRVREKIMGKERGEETVCVYR